MRAPPGQARFRRKNPAVVAVDARGDTLLAWGDGPGFSFGGSLHWQVFDAAAGRAVGKPGGGNGTIIGGSTIAAVVQDDRFLVIF